MNNNHLTDETIQAIILNEIQDNTYDAHLAGCFICRKKRDEYHALINQLQEVETETFSFDVSDLAMHAVMLFEKKKRGKQELFFWGFFAVMLIIVSSFSIPYIAQVLDYICAGSIVTTLLVTGTALIVLLIILTDIIRQYKTKEGNLFNTNLQPMS
ncbi:MAG: hypothetical protein IM638_13720 [Bacteroidetes bacterium]|nr:hypothetical protein [Bacteroidota bacterium]